MKRKTRTNLKVERLRKGDETMRSSVALDRRGLDDSPRIGVTAALKEVAESIAQNPLGRFVRTDLDYIKGVSEAGGVPVVVQPSVSLRAAEALLDGLDGLLLSGAPTSIQATTARNQYPNSGRLSPSGMRWRWRCLGWLSSGGCLSLAFAGECRCSTWH
jgi:hypothetical protein